MRCSIPVCCTVSCPWPLALATPCSRGSRCCLQALFGMLRFKAAAALWRGTAPILVVLLGAGAGAGGAGGAGLQQSVFLQSLLAMRVSNLLLALVSTLRE